MIRAATALALVAAVAAGTAQAQTPPRPLVQDNRVQLVDYDPDRITAIRAALGFQLMIEFAAGERIENVSIGDSVGWQVTPNRRANILFLKPVDGRPTNMTVVTDARRYLFDLRLAAKGARAAPAYSVRFLYPAPATAAPLAPAPELGPQVVNAAYALTGAAEITPSRVFDDGRMTYFEWPAEAALPAIFAVSAEGAESLVNYAVRDGQVVVQQLAPQFVLRNGRQVARIDNTAWPKRPAARRPQ